jgi:hypothetical protein
MLSRTRPVTRDSLITLAHELAPRRPLVACLAQYSQSCHIIMDRSRREKQDKLAQLAELKRVRQGGKREYTERESTVYDEVTDEQYRVRDIGDQL